MAQKEEELDFSKLSLEDRIQHKNWKARVSGYEDLLKLLNSITDEKSPEFNKYLPLLKQAPVDGNVSAQEKALATVLVFLENSHSSISGRIASDILSGTLSKAIISTRTKSREIANDIVLMYIETEKCELVQNELLKALEHKTPKAVASVISLIRESIKQFGPKWCKLTPFLKVIPNLFENKDKNIREETKQLTIEIYRWLKDALKSQLQGLKPVQLSELENEFVKIKDEKPTVLRFLRSQMNRVIEQTDEPDGANVSSNSGQINEANDEIDPFELLEPVEILSKLPGDFYEQMEAKKWQERKAALENFQQLMASAPKLAAGDYGEIIKVLKRTISKDTNVVVVGVGAKCLADLASKLRNLFNPYAHSCVSVVLEKFKEKKTNVVTPLREAIDAIMTPLSMELVIEDIISALDNKNPQIKSETAQFLSRYIASSNPSYIANKKVLKPLVSALVKALNDMDAVVRENSAEAIGTIMKVMSEKVLTPLLSDVDAIKMQKVKEYYEKAVVKYVAPLKPPPSSLNTKPKSIRGGGGGESRMPPKEISASQSSLKSTEDDLLKENKTSGVKKRVKSASKIGSKQTKENGDTMKKNSASTTSAPAIVSKRGKAPQAVNGSSPADKKQNDKLAAAIPLFTVNNMKEQRLNDEKSLRVLRWNFTTPREEFFVQLKEQMTNANYNTTFISNCFHTDFKYHLKAIDSLREFLAEGNYEATMANSDIILKWFALRFFDTNPSVILKSFDYLIAFFTQVKDNSHQITELEAQSFLPYLIQKTGDTKNVFRQKVHEILEVFKNVYPPIKLFSFILQGLTVKNSRQRATCLEELAFLIENYGTTVCQPSVSQALKEIGKHIGDKDSVVRNSALNCVVQAFYVEGERIYKLVGHLSDKDLSMLEERIKRASKNRPPQKPKEQLLGVKPNEISPPSISNNLSSPEEINTNTFSPRKERKLSTSSTSTFVLSPSKNSNSRMSLERAIPSFPVEDSTPIDAFKRIPYPTNQGTFTRQRPKSMAYLSNDYNDQQQDSQINASLMNLTSKVEVGEDLLRLPAVQLPKRRSIGPILSSRESPNEKADKCINAVMAELTSHEILPVIKALKNIQELIMIQDQAEALLGNKIDQLLIMCSIQFRLIIQKHIDDDSISKASVIDLYKVLINIIPTVFKCNSLGKRASRDVLKDLITIIITSILDTRVAELSEASFVIKGLNLAASTIISHSDSTNMLTALIKLLYDCVSGNCNQIPKYTEMVMKCLWKMTRLMDSYINTINLDRVLYEAHLFLDSFPSEYWKSNSHLSDAPLKTIKTVVFTIVKIKRDIIYNHLSLIPNKEKSEIYSFIERAFKTIIAKENQGEYPALSVKNTHPNNSPMAENGNCVSPSQKLGKQAHSELKEILKKFGTIKTQEGLFELYNFTITHPDFDLDTHLKNTSTEYFYSFIINGLEQIKLERKRLQCESTKGPVTVTENINDLNSTETPRLSKNRTRYNVNNTDNSMIKLIHKSSSPIDKRNIITPEFPTGENVSFDDIKKWCIDFAESCGVNKNEFREKIEKIFNEKMKVFTGDREKDYQITIALAEDVFRNVREMR